MKDKIRQVLEGNGLINKETHKLELDLFEVDICTAKLLELMKGIWVCPECGGEIKIIKGELTIYKCPYCKSTMLAKLEG